MTKQSLDDVQQVLSTVQIDADAGHSKDLESRHVNMIAIGGAIGTGLFLGAGSRLASAGPSLLIVCAVCGVFALFVVRARGELVLYRPSSGAFVSYARKFIGKKGAFTASLLHFVNWATTGIADITAVATYTHYWRMLLVFLTSGLVLMYADEGAGRTTVLCLQLIAAALVGGWFAVRSRVEAVRSGAEG